MNKSKRREQGIGENPRRAAGSVPPGGKSPVRAVGSPSRGGKNLQRVGGSSFPNGKNPRRVAGSASTNNKTPVRDAEGLPPDGNPTERGLFPVLAAHPYAAALAACLLANPFFLGAVENIPPNALWLEQLLLLAGGVRLFWFDRRDLSTGMRRFLFLLFLCADAFLLPRYARSSVKTLWIFTIGFLILLGFRYLPDRRACRQRWNCLCILGIGFLVKLSYILGTSVYTRQHDMGLFSPGSEGHAGYIEYLLLHRALPDFDVRSMWQFSHPPLHHALSAAWIALNENILLVGHNPARESLQTLTLFYALCIVLSAYGIFRYFGLTGKALYVSLAIAAFHPTFTILAGSVNNDALSVAFVTGAVLCALHWSARSTVGNILKLALCIGLGMMAKLSAAAIAPPTALLFLLVFLRDRKERGLALIGQFAAFGAVCVPLGLWYEVRNFLRWGVPLAYVHELPPDYPQYLGGVSLLSRLTDFSPSRLASPFVGFVQYGDESNETNPLLALLKSAVFGEWSYPGGRAKTAAAYALVILGAVLAVVALAAMVYVCVRKGLKHPTETGFLLAFYVTMLGMYFRMQARYPFVCTMDFRYITPTVIIGALFLGRTLDRWEKSPHTGTRTASAIVCVLTGAFSVLSILSCLVISAA